jgi:hypothetical protein
MMLELGTGHWNEFSVAEFMIDGPWSSGSLRNSATVMRWVVAAIIGDFRAICTRSAIK